jgi:septal ring-binding cell division protein DamX/type II secretory pathway predicted ATPase ExeA
VFLIGSTERELGELNRWIREQAGLVNLVGQAGVGKRTLIRALGAEDVRRVRLDCDITPDIVYASIARQLGLPLDASIEAIHAQAEILTGPMLVSVEHADRLSDPALEALVALVETPSPISIVLLSEHSLQTRLNALADRSVECKWIQLEPLNETESAQFIEHLLSQGPWTQQAKDSINLKEIFALTQGVPSAIEVCVERGRVGEPVAGLRRGRKRVAGVVGTGLFLALVLFGIWVWQWLQHDDSFAQLRTALENQRVDQAVSESLSVPAPLVRSIEPPPVAPDDRASVAPVFEPAVTLNDDQASGAKSIGAAASPAESLEAPQEEPEAEPVPSPQPTVDEADEPGMKKIELASAAQASSDLQKESTVAPRKAASKPLGYPFDEREILSRAATSYTLQLFGTQDSASALAQKATRYQALDLKIAQVKRQGKPWLIGLAGEFPDRAKAMEYASSQGELITENGFWIRRFSDVQNQIKEAAR